MLYTVVTKCKSRANDGALDKDFAFKIGPISPIIGLVNPFYCLKFRPLRRHYTGGPTPQPKAPARNPET